MADLFFSCRIKQHQSSCTWHEKYRNDQDITKIRETECFVYQPLSYSEQEILSSRFNWDGLKGYFKTSGFNWIRFKMLTAVNHAFILLTYPCWLLLRLIHGFEHTPHHSDLDRHFKDKWFEWKCAYESIACLEFVQLYLNTAVFWAECSH